jgi:oligopeptide/dipeptide ABC transporter ATP-binding protein
MTIPGPPLLEVDNLSVSLGRPPMVIPITTGVSFTVSAGQTLGVVGESGSGKSLTMLAVIGLLPSGVRVTAGRVLLGGTDLTAASEREYRASRGRDIAMVFQDPMTSLNPVMPIGIQVTEALVGEALSRSQKRERAIELLDQVGLSVPRQRLRQYPHQLSGGMRQRVLLAIALARRPRLLIADEPTTALDVTTQVQIIELIRSLQRDLRLGVIWVSHDLAVIARVATDVVVMYGGRLVEHARASELFRLPCHPYTRGLLRSTPRLDQPRTARLAAIPGRPPAPGAQPPGCPFAPRCGEAGPECERQPPLITTEPVHLVACHHATSSEGVSHD